jgi:hypothetical protein
MAPVQRRLQRAADAEAQGPALEVVVVGRHRLGGLAGDQDEDEAQALPRRAAAPDEVYEPGDDRRAHVHGRHAREPEEGCEDELRPEGQPQRDAHRRRPLLQPIGREQRVRRLRAVERAHRRHVGGREGAGRVALGDERVDPAERRRRLFFFACTEAGCRDVRQGQRDEQGGERERVVGEEQRAAGGRRGRCERRTNGGGESEHAEARGEEEGGSRASPTRNDDGPRGGAVGDEECGLSDAPRRVCCSAAAGARARGGRPTPHRGRIGPAHDRENQPKILRNGQYRI